MCLDLFCVFFSGGRASLMKVLTCHFLYRAPLPIEVINSKELMFRHYQRISSILFKLAPFIAYLLEMYNYDQRSESRFNDF